MVNLTAKGIEGLKATDKRLAMPDSTVPGLEITVTRRGVKTFSVRYRLIDGRRKRLTLGRYPILTLADARAMALEALGEVARGGDPASTKKRAKFEARSAAIKTVQDLGQELLAASRLKGLRPSTLAYYTYLLNKHIYPLFGSYGLLELTSKMVRPELRTLGMKAGPITANRVLTLMKRMYNFAIEEELLDANPVARIKFAYAEKSRERVLSKSELKAVWAVLALAHEPPRAGQSDRDSLAVSPAMALAIELCALTCQRGNEVIGIRWGEIDLEARTWVLPAERSKSKRANVVPLSDGAIKVIRRAAALASVRYMRPLTAIDALFPSSRAYGRKTLGAKAEDPSGIAPCERLSVNRAMARVTALAKVENATVHDLRRTGATIMASEEVGALGEIVGRILNHSAVTYGVTGIYNRYNYIKEKRAALDALSNLLCGLYDNPLDGDGPSHHQPLTPIIPLKSRSASFSLH